MEILGILRYKWLQNMHNMPQWLEIYTLVVQKIRKNVHYVNNWNIPWNN